MPNYAADDTDFIARRLKQIEKEKTERINSGEVAPETEGQSQGDQADDASLSYMGQPLAAYVVNAPSFGDVQRTLGGSFEVWDGTRWITEEQAQDRNIQTNLSEAAMELACKRIKRLTSDGGLRIVVTYEELINAGCIVENSQ